MLRQYSTGNIFKNNAKTLEHPRPCSVLGGSGGGGRALPQDWGEHGGGVVPISDFIRLPGMQILIWWEVYLPKL